MKRMGDERFCLGLEPCSHLIEFRGAYARTDTLYLDVIIIGIEKERPEMILV